MDTYLNSLFKKHKNKGAVIDSNLLILYFIGNYNINLVSSFSKTKQFATEEFYFLDLAIKYFNFIATTPNILTEVNNLSNDLDQKNKPELPELLKNGIQLFKEDYFESSSLVKDKFYTKIGLTDISIMNLAKKGFIVLTTDFTLKNILEHLNVDVINWNNLKPYIWEYNDLFK
ncbi:MAG: PIN domain-containing protein [Candidatus Humimicrobiaceae bacterium]